MNMGEGMTATDSELKKKCDLAPNAGGGVLATQGKVGLTGFKIVLGDEKEAPKLLGSKVLLS